MDLQKRNEILKRILEVVELPDSAYEKTVKRYSDVSEWLNRSESKSKDFDPHIFPQGSFSLGTAIKPINENEEYDLDIACKLRKGITKSTYTQFQLKSLVGAELELYRIARQIQSPCIEKHRCWRLAYKDELSFHMDIVPGIPETEIGRNLIFEALQRSGESIAVASEIVKMSMAITDDRMPQYKEISDDWEISNPEGYSYWFQMKMKNTLNEGRIVEDAKVDNLPIYKRKTPLQRSIQFLKRHRDQWCVGLENCKPISIIITTLAAEAYEGQQDLYSALNGILTNMGNYVNPTEPRVPNPTNPSEDFADKWNTSEGKKLQLEKNFWSWLKQAQIDFESICTDTNVNNMQAILESRYNVFFKPDTIAEITGSTTAMLLQPTTIKINNKAEYSKPWLCTH